jgi:hypothetical protein
MRVQMASVRCDHHFVAAASEQVHGSVQHGHVADRAGRGANADGAARPQRARPA